MEAANHWALMVLLIVAWYAFSLHLNVVVKEALMIYPDALTLTMVQFIVAAVAGRMLQGMKLLSLPSLLPNRMGVRVLPIAVFFYLGNLCTNCALGSISVGFTHILKTLEPLCAIAITRIVLGESPSSASWFGLITILCGVGTVIISDLNFSFLGMFFALSSNIFLPLRNVYSVSLMSGETDRLSAFQLFFATTHLSALIAICIQMIRWLIVSIVTPSETPALNSVVNINLLITGLSFMAMHSTSYIILERLQPITHAIMNCFKRAFIIFGSALVLGTGLSVSQIVGIGLALTGLYVYSRAKKMQGGMKTWPVSKVIMCVSVITFAISLLTASDGTFSHNPIVKSKTLSSVYMQKLNGNLGVIGSALPHVLRKADMMHDFPNPFAPTIHFLWLHPIPMTDTALRNVIDLASYANTVVHCGSEECEAQIGSMKQEGMAVMSRTLVVPEICRDTPLYGWTRKHVFYKLRAGPNYQKQLTQVVAMCVLYKMGGIYVDNSVALDANLDLTKLPKGPWVSDQLGLFHVSHFPPNHELLLNMMDNYVPNYPPWWYKGTQWPSVYDFVDVVKADGTKLKTVNVAELGFVSRPVILPAGMRQYATMKYNLRNITQGINLGDEIQTFGGIQFLPHIDHFVTRDLLHTYKFDNNVTFFINAWIGDKRFDWPYQLYMDPIMVAIHLASHRYINSTKKIQYLKSKAPIGARDLKTLERLNNETIPSYFSGCATILTQNPYDREERPKTIYIIDVWKESDKLMRILPDEVSRDIIDVTHGPQFSGIKFDNIGRFLYSADLVFEKYAKARAIITQRIHAAMPSVGLGVPVIFFGNTTLPGGGADRLSGLTKMWHFFDAMENEEELKVRMKELFGNNGPHGNPNPELQHRIKNDLFSHILSQHTKELRNAAQMYGVIKKGAQFDPIAVEFNSDNLTQPPDPGLMNVSYKDTHPH
uniref:Sugar phosphate transporter domain-containing protein n=1 Tax=Plectus sambesii TaxID=2011161 RepID=A0A914WN06_9BILA